STEFKDKEECVKDFQMAKPKVGQIIRKEMEGRKFTLFKKVELEGQVEMSVAIDKHTASSEKGMLFAYEYKFPEKMWALAQPGEVLDSVDRIFIGRGKSRGFGWVDVRKKKEIDVEEEGKGKYYCLSQCVPTLFGKTYFQVDKIYGDLSYYISWFTNDEHEGYRPSFKALKEGSIIQGERTKENPPLLSAGLNFAIKIEDLTTLLRWQA
ncbi:RAMP superfamily CRISPR-associated protein, partial [Acidianus sp. RZ1]